MWLIILALIVCYGIACYFSAQLIVKAAMDKGYEDQGLKLAFIIVFATPASAAMIVAALPDKRLQTSVSDNPVLSTIDAELPKL
ncbi:MULTISPECIES: hypothetical protein [unclassified Collinsella]|uniref:hypothetical protein n=1 Tax=unclassified Collinsella TaxID=2637548 RepID=UPI000E45042D|nr:MULTISPECIES: hypothetical protein [unclassified Collinsella]RGL10529.1 hypothetical protein DXC79_09525 [Collinsella sp. TF08-11AT]RGX78243.1 hypothetical protein DXA64_08050 [Collinsella sp. OF03-4AA]RHJ56786.1 hypothetical protein DW112_09560 [Collinsella sp. AM09-41]